MTIISSYKVTCATSGCKNEISLTGTEAKIGALYVKARKAGWRWPNAATQYCPDHAARKAKAKAAPAKRARKTAPKKRPGRPVSVKTATRREKANQKPDLSSLVTSGIGGGE